MSEPLRTAPAYAVASVDHAPRIATMLQLEGGLTVSEIATRLGVARSTAHRLLAMLVYRDFAVQDEERHYHPGPVLELAVHSPSAASRLRAAALPHLARLVDLLGETANLIVRTGESARFIASAESLQSVRVGLREGMVFPAHRVTGGLLLLADLPDEQLDAVYAGERHADRPSERLDLEELRRQLGLVRRNGYALNDGLSERGVVAVGVPVRGSGGDAVASLSVSMPSVRFERGALRQTVTTLTSVARDLESALTATG